MKKILIFTLAFAGLFLLFQLIFGMVSTFVYTPDIDEAWNSSVHLAQQGVIMSRSGFPYVSLFIGIISATIAYLFSIKQHIRKT